MAVAVVEITAAEVQIAADVNFGVHFERIHWSNIPRSYFMILCCWSWLLVSRCVEETDGGYIQARRRREKLACAGLLSFHMCGILRFKLSPGLVVCGGRSFLYLLEATSWIKVRR